MIDVSDFYDRHPISEAQVLAALRRRRGGSPTRRSAPTISSTSTRITTAAWPRWTRSRAGPASTRARRVLDVCAGLGGPARFVASRRGCARHRAWSSTPGARAGARPAHPPGRSPRAGARRPRRCPAPCRSPHGRFDGGASARRRCCTSATRRRVLARGASRAGARRPPGLQRLDRATLARRRRAPAPRRVDGRRHAPDASRATGRCLAPGRLRAVEPPRTCPTSGRTILRERARACFARMREDTVARLGEARYEEYDQLYAFFVGLIEAGKLGGGRFSASR